MGKPDDLDSILADMKAARGWFDHMMGRIETLVNAGVNGALDAPVTDAEPVSRNDPKTEITVFVQARLAGMTDLGIALAVAERFPDAPPLTMAQIAAQRQAERWKNGR